MISVIRDFLSVPYCVEEWLQDACDDGISLEQLSIEVVFDRCIVTFQEHDGSTDVFLFWWSSFIA